MSLHRFYAYLAFLLVILQVVVILLSWFVAAAFPTLPIRSLLSSEGVRWFLGSVVTNMASPMLVWLLLLGIAVGTLRGSGLLHAFKEQLNYRQRMVVRLVIIELLLAILIVLGLTAVPHAILLSITGHLFPSSFSAGIVPMLSAIVAIMSISYAWMSGRLHGIEEAVMLLESGIRQVAPLTLLYLLGVQLWFSSVFVLAYMV